MLRLQHIHVHLSTSHRDIPENSKLLAQLISDNLVFAQTISVNGQDGSWRVAVERTIPVSIAKFSIAILREHPMNINRLLGIVAVEGHSIREHGQSVELPLDIVKVNDDGPSLLLTASFLVLPLTQRSTDQSQAEFEQFSLDPKHILSRLAELDGISASGSQVGLREISLLHEGLLLLPSEHGDKAKFLNLLGNICSNDEDLAEVDDLHKAVEIYKDAIREANCVDESKYWTNLGLCLWILFERVGDMSHLDRSIEIFADVVFRTPDGHPDKLTYLTNLSVPLLARFERFGNLADLDRCIQAKEDAVLLTPDAHPDKLTLLNNLGNSLIRRFDHTDDLSDLDRSIQVREAVLLFTQDGHPARPRYFNRLGGLLLRRFERLGELSDLDRSIQVREEAVLFTPDGHPDKPSYLNDLGNSLLARFERLGHLSDLHRSVQVSDDSILLTPDDHPDKPMYLFNLGHTLLRSFERVGNLIDLERSIPASQNAIILTPDGDPEKPDRLSTLGSALWHRFHRLGDLSDLTWSIQVHNDAVSLLPDGHPRKPRCLDNLRKSLLARFKRLGDVDSLTKSIEIGHNVVALTPDSHPDKPVYLNGLGITLDHRFERFGDVSDLSRSIQLTQDAIALMHESDSHPEKSRCLQNFGSLLLARFERFGDVDDLNKSVEINHGAALLLPDTHPDKPALLDSLSNSLFRRFSHLRDLADLDKSIQIWDDALTLTPEKHPDKPARLTNLGVSLFRRFERLGNVVDLDRSIQSSDAAVLLISDGHPSKLNCLSYLGGALLGRFERLGDLSDLHRSIQVSDAAVLLTPDGHPKKPMYLNNLGNSLSRRFQQLGDLSDLDRSIEVNNDATILTPDGHSDKPLYLQNLGHSLSDRFDRRNDVKDLHAAILCYSSAATSVAGSSRYKFQAATHWMDLARQHLPDQALEPCSIAMNLLPQLMWLGASIQDRHHQSQTTKAGTLVRDAAATAVAAAQSKTAVEWLEQGRSVIWNQLLQLRTPVDVLREVHPAFADKLESLSSQLEGFGSHNDTVDHQQLAKNREDLLQQIRGLPGFDQYLLPKKLAQLLRAADKGPIVMLNVSKVSCDALILYPGGDNVLHVPLKDLTVQQTLVWRDAIEELLVNGVFSTRDFDTRKGIRVSDHGEVLNRETGLAYILKELWHSIADPVLKALGITKRTRSSSDVRRLWWCPTGPLTFLPIHAAGVFPDGPKLSDFVVSSYTPTITLILDNPRTERTTKRQLLTVALPSESRLPGTEKEIEGIVKHAQQFSVLQLSEREAIPRHVSEAMKASHWVHFACHGKQNNSDPTESCLFLSGSSKLSLNDIIKLRLENAELAFLSACETATGDKYLAEEAVHLTAGMLLAGYRTVIATMWSINDDIAVEIADETYRLLFQQYDADHTRAAEALHFAIEKVRENRERKGSSLPLFSWVPFIHMGL